LLDRRHGCKECRFCGGDEEIVTRFDVLLYAAGLFFLQLGTSPPRSVATCVRKPDRITTETYRIVLYSAVRGPCSAQSLMKLGRPAPHVHKHSIQIDHRSKLERTDGLRDSPARGANAIQPETRKKKNFPIQIDKFPLHFERLFSSNSISRRSCVSEHGRQKYAVRQLPYASSRMP
jgi:hypothetical protein